MSNLKERVNVKNIGAALFQLPSFADGNKSASEATSATYTAAYVACAALSGVAITLKSTLDRKLMMGPEFVAVCRCVRVVVVQRQALCCLCRMPYRNHGGSQSHQLQCLEAATRVIEITCAEMRIKDIWIQVSRL